MQIDMRASARSQTVRSYADRPQAGSGLSSLLDAYLPAEKAEKFHKYEALAGDTRSWQASLKTRGIFEADLARMTKAGDDYLPILKRAMDNQAFADPKAFLKTLSADDLQTLQYTHGLADPINVDGLSQEGALNLLLPPNDSQMDVDGDGLASVGAAKNIIFPPANAPKDVDDAWAEATAGASDEERASLTMSMHLAPPPGMLVVDGEAFNPGSTSLNDIGSFRSLVSRALESLMISRRYENEQQRAFSDRIGGLLEKFDQALHAREATNG